MNPCIVQRRRKRQPNRGTRPGRDELVCGTGGFTPSHISATSQSPATGRQAVVFCTVTSKLQNA